MQTNEQIEQQVWEYIDGACSAAESQRIALLVQNDPLWKAAYTELQVLHAGIGANMELSEPHVRFTKNVMDAIAAVQPVRVPKIFINIKIIRGIAASFAAVVSLLVVYMLFSSNWASPSRLSLSRINIPDINFAGLSNPAFVNTALGIIVILGLAFLDQALRTRHTQQR